MRILYINTVPTEMNGITNAIIETIKAIREDSFVSEISYVSINELSTEYRLFFEKNQVNTFVVNRKNPFLYSISLIKIIKANSFDIVHAHGNSRTLTLEMVSAKIGGCKLCIAHGQNSSTNHPIIHKLLAPLFFATVDVGLACSDIAGRFLFSNKPYTVLRNGISFSKFSVNYNRRITTRTQFGYLEEDIVLGNIGRLCKEKNQLFLLDVMKKLVVINRHFRLLLIGDGNLKTELELRVRDFGLEDNVILAGALSSETVLDAFDVFLMPSIFEGLPIALIEAQANGLHCFCSDSITREACIDNMIDYLPIDGNSVDIWVNKITGFVNNKNNKQGRLSVVNFESDFNIMNSIKQLEHIYSCNTETD